MKISKPHTSLFILAISGLALSGAYHLSKIAERPKMKLTKQASSFNLNDSSWRFFNLGQKRLMSSLLWVSTIIESDVDKYPSRDLNSWMFLRFKTIAELEPKFYQTYAFGGPYLSIIKDDLTGASYIYDKGLEIFPESKHLLFNAGFHYEYEIKDSTKSLPILRRLSLLDKSSLLTTTLAKIEAKGGDLNSALLLLNKYQESFPQGSMIGEKIFNNRYAIKAQLDLECLNLKKDHQCERRDLEGNFYLIKDGFFQAQKKWEKFQ